MTTKYTSYTSYINTDMSTFNGTVENKYKKILPASLTFSSQIIIKLKLAVLTTNY